MRMLKDLRKSNAKKLGVPPFVIFQDPSLEDMALKYPITIEELYHIHGVGEGKAKRYGKDFVKLIKRYVDENDIERYGGYDYQVHRIKLFLETLHHSKY